VFGCDASLAPGQSSLRFGGELAQALGAAAVGYAMLMADGESPEHLALGGLEMKLLYLFADMIDHGVPLDLESGRPPGPAPDTAGMQALCG
jgi:hypothetical protein